MTWLRRFRIREHLRTALWPVPLACGVGGQLAGMIVWRVDRFWEWTLLAFQPGGAMALAGATVGAMITFVGIVFSVLLVAVQFASTQMTPRALRTSLSDPMSRAALGVFVGTLTYTLTVMARVTDTFVPQLGVLVIATLVVVSLASFVMLVHHVGQALRPVNVVARIGARGRRTLEETYRDPIREGEGERKAEGAGGRGSPTRAVRHAGAPGVVLAVDVAGLVAAARRADARIALAPAVGDFVPCGAPLFRLFERAAPVNEPLLLGSVAIGHERTLEQDPTFVFRILVDVALKALSPAINDPTSAVMALDQLHDLLRWVGARRLDVGEHRDVDGHVRLTIDMPSWEDFVSLAVDEVRQAGAGSMQIARRLRAMLEDLLETVPEVRKAAVRQELGAITRGVERAIPDADDRSRASVADAQGLGSSPRPQERDRGQWGFSD